MWIHESHLQGMIMVLHFSVFAYLYRVHLYTLDEHVSIWMHMSLQKCSQSLCVFRNSPPLCVTGLTQPGTH